MNDSEKLLLSKLIGFINGSYNIMNLLIESKLREIMHAIKNDDLSLAIDLVAQLKEDYLPGCISCTHPCGNTSDYVFDEKNIHNVTEKYQKLKEIYTDEMPISTLCESIASLAWED